MSLARLQIEQELKRIDALMLEKELQYAPLFAGVHPAQRNSSVNLLHYLTLRSIDLRNLQNSLHEEGFSTLAHAESHIRGQILAVLKHFNYVNGEPPCDHSDSQAIIMERVNHLFGKTPGSALPSIMVTFQTSFARDAAAVRKLLKAGMSIARINCAHDDETTWLQMVEIVREESASTGIPCKIYMDLAGPKIRTRVNRKKGRIQVKEGNVFLLTDNDSLMADLPVVECTIPGVAAQLKIGERVFFDDGLIEAKVAGSRPEGIEMAVVRVSSKKPFLKTGKGINFPDSTLFLSALTDFDRKCIPFVLEHADMIGYSFVHNTPDLLELQREVREKELPIILKIETPEAFKNLPSLLFTAMTQQYFGLMIARGDLAVEMGFEQMGEVQDEIMAMCRAGHIPVIYATQVLENMNKIGIPTRAEITDASYGILADCVMLNKGAHTLQAIRVLKDIFRRKGDHFFNDRPVYRSLGITADFFKTSPVPDIY